MNTSNRILILCLSVDICLSPRHVIMENICVYRWDSFKATLTRLSRHQNCPCFLCQHLKLQQSKDENMNLSFAVQIVEKIKELEEQRNMKIFLMDKCKYLWNVRMSTLQRLSGLKTCTCFLCQLVLDWKKENSRMTEQIQNDHEYPSIFPRGNKPLLDELKDYWKDKEDNLDNLNKSIKSEHDYCLVDDDPKYLELLPFY